MNLDGLCSSSPTRKKKKKKSGKTPGQCLVCRASDHRTPKCPQIRCIFCGESGHAEIDCKLKKEYKRKEEESKEKEKGGANGGRTPEDEDSSQTRRSDRDLRNKLERLRDRKVTTSAPKEKSISRPRTSSGRKTELRGRTIKEDDPSDPRRKRSHSHDEKKGKDRRSSKNRKAKRKVTREEHLTPDPVGSDMVEALLSRSSRNEKTSSSLSDSETHDLYLGSQYLKFDVTPSLGLDLPGEEEGEWVQNPDTPSKIGTLIRNGTRMTLLCRSLEFDVDPFVNVRHDLNSGDLIGFHTGPRGYATDLRKIKLRVRKAVVVDMNPHNFMVKVVDKGADARIRVFVNPDLRLVREAEVVLMEYAIGGGHKIFRSEVAYRKPLSVCYFDAHIMKLRDEERFSQIGAVSVSQSYPELSTFFRPITPSSWQDRNLLDLLNFSIAPGGRGVIFEHQAKGLLDPFCERDALVHLIQHLEDTSLDFEVALITCEDSILFPFLCKQLSSYGLLDRFLSVVGKVSNLKTILNSEKKLRHLASFCWGHFGHVFDALCQEVLPLNLSSDLLAKSLWKVTEVAVNPEDKENVIDYQLEKYLKKIPKPPESFYEAFRPAEDDGIYNCAKFDSYRLKVAFSTNPIRNNKY